MINLLDFGTHVANFFLQISITVILIHAIMEVPALTALLPIHVNALRDGPGMTVR